MKLNSNLMTDKELKVFLDHKAAYYNNADFIKDDPVGIPHYFSLKQDIEITGFFAAIMAWGQRRTIIDKCWELIAKMDYAPHDFILNHQAEDLDKFENFKHRTFKPVDIQAFIRFFHRYYRQYESLESAFYKPLTPADENPEKGLNNFFRLFTKLSMCDTRTLKHVAAPDKKSSCKRINMFLRWMVREDDKGVDFGIWENIKPALLTCPIDVHVARVAKSLGLLSRNPVDWQAALELTNGLKAFDPDDPVKYDFALFGLGKIEGYASKSTKGNSQLPLPGP